MRRTRCAGWSGPTLFAYGIMSLVSTYAFHYFIIRTAKMTVLRIRAVRFGPSFVHTKNGLAFNNLNNEDLLDRTDAQRGTADWTVVVLFTSNFFNSSLSINRFSSWLHFLIVTLPGLFNVFVSTKFSRICGLITHNIWKPWLITRKSKHITPWDMFKSAGCMTS